MTDAPAAPLPLRVMTFNVRGSFVDDGANVWPARRELNIATIRRAAPDIVGLQEVQTGNWDDYRAHLADYGGELGPRYNNGEPFCYPSILWRADRFEPAGRGGCWLSETPEAWSGSWGTNCVRSMAWVRLRPLAGGPTVLAANTHLDHISEPARVGQAGVLLEHIARTARPGDAIVLTGDFNCQPGSDVYGRIADAGFADAWRSAGCDDGPGVFTFHAFTGREAEPPSHGRIDWIWTGGEAGIETSSAEIIRDAQPPIYPSDHFPVVADLAVRPAPDGRSR